MKHNLKMISGLIFCIIVQIWSIGANPTQNPVAESTTSSDLCPCPKNDTTQSPPPSIGSMGLPSTFNMENMHTTLVHGMPCVCNVGFRSAVHRDDYHYTPGVGAHKLHTRAVAWNEARKMCIDEGGHLAIVNSQLEAHMLMKMFERSGPVKGASYGDMAFLGIHDLYKEGEWVTIQGDSLFKTGYTEWSDKWGGQPDNGGGKQHCGVLLKEGGLDDVSCDVPFAYFCEIPNINFLH